MAIESVMLQVACGAERFRVVKAPTIPEVLLCPQWC